MNSATRRIVVTGVSRGLGLAMAEGFIDAGHIVCGCATSERSIRELRERWAVPHSFEPVDVADDLAAKAWAEKVLADVRPIF